MTLIKFKNPNKADLLPYFPSVFESFFSDFMNSDLAEKNVFRSVPSVNISETPEKFLVEIVSPGMKKEEFKLEVENKVLTISAERKEEKKDENNRYTRREFSYSSFSRSFTLPETVMTDTISAEYKDGILSIIIPKKEAEKQKPVKEIVVS
jgi:HSP20 family protein